MIERIEVITHVMDQMTPDHRLGGVELMFGQSAAQLCGARFDHQTELGQHATNTVEQRRSLLDPAQAQAVPCQSLLLGFGLDRNGRMPGACSAARIAAASARSFLTA
ncbi:hypothetical protein [Thauera sp. SDU_THAU2]|uniref:hypothetical protein n=1 Tax=Thauera sp. SDU_THAU2 TaxID=3136633 RepID=UPI00311FDD14